MKKKKKEIKISENNSKTSKNLYEKNPFSNRYQTFTNNKKITNVDYVKYSFFTVFSYQQ